MDERGENLFKQLKPRAEEFGVDEGTLRRAIEEAHGDAGTVVKNLAIAKTSVNPTDELKMNDRRKEALFTGDAMSKSGQPKVSKRLSAFRDDAMARQTNNDRLKMTRNKMGENRPEKLFPEGSDILNVHRKRMGDNAKAVRHATENQPKHPDDEVVFPDDNEDYNMLELVQQSIASYKKKKNLFNDKSNKNLPYSSITAQMY